MVLAARAYAREGLHGTHLSTSTAKGIVLSVPRYDYAWELEYMTTIAVPKGTKLVVETHYDNSAANRNNPNPNTWVYRGQQRWEEMQGAVFGVVVDADVKDGNIVSQGMLGPVGGKPSYGKDMTSPEEGFDA